MSKTNANNQEQAYLYGANFAANSSMSFSDIYLNLPPPLPFNLLTSRPTKAAHPRLATRQPRARVSNIRVLLDMTQAQHLEINHLLYTQIPRRKDINPLECKTGEHLNRPPPQPTHGRKPLHQLLITRPRQNLRTQLPTRKLLRQPLNILGLPLRQTRRP